MRLGLLLSCVFGVLGSSSGFVRWRCMVLRRRALSVQSATNLVVRFGCVRLSVQLLRSVKEREAVSKHSDQAVRYGVSDMAGNQPRRVIHAIVCDDLRHPKKTELNVTGFLTKESVQADATDAQHIRTHSRRDLAGPAAPARTVWQGVADEAR